MKKLKLEANEHHALVCPKCGRELWVLEMRNIRGSEEWEMKCLAGHRCLLLWDFWDEPQVKIFVTMLPEEEEVY